MITFDEARQIAQEQIASFHFAPKKDSLILLEDATIEKEWGWVFFFTSRLWHETKDFRHALAGNAPFIVERSSGRVVSTGTAHPLDDYLERYEKYGDPHFEPGPSVCLAGCPQDIDRLAAASLLRSHLGLGLLKAGQLVEGCLNGQRPYVTTEDPKNTDSFIQDLESLGFVVERLSKDDSAGKLHPPAKANKNA